MKKAVLFFLVCAAAITLRSETGDWLRDFGAARKQAKAENKRLLLLFSGSDWCVNCIKWKKEVFSQPDFQEFASKNLVLVLVDFPEEKELPQAQRRANETLRGKYKIGEFPTALVLDADAKKLGAIKYLEGGPKAFFEKLEKLKE